jgi:hypothetical protein
MMQRDEKRGGPRIWWDVNSLEYEYRQLMEDITTAMHKVIPFRTKNPLKTMPDSGTQSCRIKALS